MSINLFQHHGSAKAEQTTRPRTIYDLRCESERYVQLQYKLLNQDLEGTNRPGYESTVHLLGYDFRTLTRKYNNTFI